MRGGRLAGRSWSLVAGACLVAAAALWPLAGADAAFFFAVLGVVAWFWDKRNSIAARVAAESGAGGRASATGDDGEAGETEFEAGGGEGINEDEGGDGIGGDEDDGGRGDSGGGVGKGDRPGGARA